LEDDLTIDGFNEKPSRDHRPVGAAEGCDLLILLLGVLVAAKRSQPSAAPTRGNSSVNRQAQKNARLAGVFDRF
jgi:hypothetical protein